MIKFIEHDADKMERGVDNLTEELYNTEKEKLTQIGIMEVNQSYNKKMNIINKETAT